MKKNKGQKLWKKAKKIIPGGSMLFSKKSELHLPNKWPSYYTKSSGYNVWDLDNNKYIDMMFAVGTNILGYCNRKVDEEVRKIISSGVMTSLNCFEEVELAEKLIELHPWSDMARFARSGGEANTIAIRLARAASGRDKIAVCGYHGWHDWYLAANLKKSSILDNHLLPGLESKGVPKNLKNTIMTFEYNDINRLNEIISNNKIGAIKMEVSRNQKPSKEFLKKIRRISSKNNIILIFDECTSGFRQSLGGIHLNYGINPDMAVFGKALGNGYAISSVVGKKDIMKEANSSFISSTFWTERIGPVAALKTLEIINKTKSWKKIPYYGSLIKKSWEKLANKYDLSITIQGIDSLPSFYFNYKNNYAYKTYLTQEMLKRKYLASNLVYVSLVHSKEIIEKYIEILDPIFLTIKECENGKNIFQLLDGPICQSGFKRLN
tara:strand:+ start:135 stop:1442 length:1308 start_codon:yes stop_codon:yes gene_type:complete